MIVTRQAQNQGVYRRREPQFAQAVSSVTDALNALCDTLGPGGRIPTHTELMRRFGASERAVRVALEEMRQGGRIVRRHGSGTFVADAAQSAAAADGPDYLGSFTTPENDRTIVAVVRADHSFFDYCLDVLCSYAEDSGDFTVFCKPLRSGEVPTPENLGALAVNPKGRRFLLFGYFMAPVTKYLRDQGAHVVLVGTPPPDEKIEIPCVYGNQEYGGYLIARHLVQLGHRHIAFIHTDSGFVNSLRWQGLQQALREAGRQGIAVKNSIVPLPLDAWDADPALAREYLRQPGAPTALMAWNDRSAMRLLSVLRRGGVRVPEEVSVTGYDDLPEGRIFHPPLTTVDPGVRHQLRAAVDLLLKDSAGSEDNAPPAVAPGIAMVIPALVIGESTAPPPSGVEPP